MALHHRYLKLCMSVLRIFSIIFIVLGCGLGCAMFLSGSFHGVGQVWPLCVLLLGLCGAAVLYALAESLRLLIHIEANVRT